MYMSMFLYLHRNVPFLYPRNLPRFAQISIRELTRALRRCGALVKRPSQRDLSRGAADGSYGTIDRNPKGKDPLENHHFSGVFYVEFQGCRYS